MLIFTNLKLNLLTFSRAYFIRNKYNNIIKGKY